MVPGFNHNIKHKGRVFHIQTEDSGSKNPHIITHLFVGGNIMATKKTTYGAIVGEPEFEKTVRSMMEEQHKQMLRNLINGVYDTVDTGKAYHLDGPAPLNTEGTAEAPPADVSAAPVGPPAAGGVDVQPAEAQPAAALPPEVQAARELPASERTEPAPESRPVPGTIFGEDLISEKSLDEVILSYLAEDLADVD